MSWSFDAENHYQDLPASKGFRGKHAVDRTLLPPSPELDVTVRALYAIACAESAEPALWWLESYYYDVFGTEIEAAV